MRKRVLKIAKDINHEPDIWISLIVTTPLLSDDRRQQERTQKAHHDWGVREQKAFYTIRINMD